MGVIPVVRGIACNRCSSRPIVLIGRLESVHSRFWPNSPSQRSLSSGMPHVRLRPIALAQTQARAQICLLACVCLLAGCQWKQPDCAHQKPAADHYRAAATAIEFPNVAEACDAEGVACPSPLAARDGVPTQYQEMSLEEAVQVALGNSPIMRDLGGLVLRSPGTTQTVHGPAITEMDPRFGVEAALSAFDAQVSSSAFFENNDRALNNAFFGGGTRQLAQDVGTYQSQISKRTAMGTLLALRQNTGYDSNNAPANLFRSAWNTNVEAEFRQPLLQGNGVNFNRIQGPNGIPGLPAGVLVARINTDISLADFEAGLIEFVSNVENAYWDLYFAYRDLDAKIAARDSALETWQKTYALYETGRRGGEADKEAEAREQYYRFQEEVHNAWNGRLLEGTRTYNGSSGGTARLTSGVRVSERRLRLLIGRPISDGQLIRPSDEPPTPRIEFDWDAVQAEALTRRAQLRRQRWLIKRRELEVVGARNFLWPTLDTVGRYRWRGFGHDLVAGGPRTNALGERQFNSAVQDLASLDFQEWQLGVEFSMPLGRRRAHAAVRNAELQLARERAILREQERQVVHDVSNAVAEARRAYEMTQIVYNRRIAALTQVRAVQEAFESEKVPLDNVLEAQRRLAEVQTRYFAALVDHALAVKNVHFEKGSLLDYNAISLSEGPWPSKAYDDADRRAALRRPPSLVLNYVLGEPLVVTRRGAPTIQYTQSPVARLPGEEEVLPDPPTPPEAPPEVAPEASLQRPAGAAPSDEDLLPAAVRLGRSEESLGGTPDVQPAAFTEPLSSPRPDGSRVEPLPPLPRS